MFHDKMADGNSKIFFEKVVNFKCLGNTPNKQHFMHEEIMSKLHPGIS